MKRNENEPDNKALERLKEFNRQRQAIPGENKNETTKAGKERNKNPGATGEDNPGAGNNKKNIKKSPKK